MKEIVKIASETGKLLVTEKLAFEKKKLSLRGAKNKYSRMLSSFSYNKTIGSIESAAFKKGIKIYKANLTFTIIISKAKFSETYGLSNHRAAALVIPRRACISF